MAARRYEFYFRVVKTIYCFVIVFLLYRQEHFCTNNSVKAGNDVVDILTSKDMENTSLESQM